MRRKGRSTRSAVGFVVIRVIGTLTFFALCSGWAAAIVCSSSSCCQFIAILAVSVGRCALLLGAPAKILPPADRSWLLDETVSA